MRKNEDLIDLLLLSAAIDSIETYPAATIDNDDIRVERTDWQSGWNKCHLEILQRHGIFYSWYKTFTSNQQSAIVELIRNDVLYLSFVNDEVEPWVIMNDIFYFACGDGEGISDAEILQVHDMWEKFGYAGVIAFVSKKRGVQPLESDGKTYCKAREYLG